MNVAVTYNNNSYENFFLYPNPNVHLSDETALEMQE